jgi:hypothetical protein
MRVLFALTALGALALAGCDLNPPAPQKAATQVVCNCPKPPPAVTPPEPLPTVTPEPKPHAGRHHVRHYARRHRSGGSEDYAYDYHGGSTYTDDTDHHRHAHDWVDGYGRHHAIWDEASAGSDYDPRWRDRPYHGYDVDCPNQPPAH